MMIYYNNSSRPCDRSCFSCGERCIVLSWLINGKVQLFNGSLHLASFLIWRYFRSASNLFCNYQPFQLIPKRKGVSNMHFSLQKAPLSSIIHGSTTTLASSTYMNRFRISQLSPPNPNLSARHTIPHSQFLIVIFGFFFTRSNITLFPLHSHISNQVQQYMKHRALHEIWKLPCWRR